jgi:hypothetical protein
MMFNVFINILIKIFLNYICKNEENINNNKRETSKKKSAVIRYSLF